MATPKASRVDDDALDGRARRGRRNRDAIVDALFALVGEGTVWPTADAVAARAGVGIRSVFRHFADMESLYAALDARLVERVRTLLERPPVAGSAPARLRAVVAHRAAFFEQIAPYKRAAVAQASGSPFLQARHRTLGAVLRADLRRRVPEVDRAPREVAAAIELATSFEAWDRLRTDQRLGPARAQQVVERIVLAFAPALGASKEAR